MSNLYVDKTILADGSAADPALKFANDLNSGLYRISEDKIGIATGGSRVGEIGAGYGGFTGNIIQVVSTTKTDTTTFSTTFGDIAGLSVSITPRYSTSRIIIMAHISFGKSADIFQFFKLLRDSTDICIADTAGSRIRTATAPMLTASTPSHALMQSTVPIMFLDSPSTTSSITYKIQGRVDAGVGYINRSGADGDSTAYGRSTSTIMAMEVQQ
jgi:hypothetical protein